MIFFSLQDIFLLLIYSLLAKLTKMVMLKIIEHKDK